MSAPVESISGWLVPVPGLIYAVALFVSMWLVFRRRRWRDVAFLRRQVRMPPEHIAQKPKEVRDLQAGESGWVSRYNVVTSKRGRVFVSWTATLEEKPENPDNEFAPL